MELAQGESLRFALVASSLLHLRVSAGRGPGYPVPQRLANFARVDQHTFTLRAPTKRQFVVTLANVSNESVDVAVFFRILPRPTTGTG